MPLRFSIIIHDAKFSFDPINLKWSIITANVIPPVIRLMFNDLYIFLKNYVAYYENV